eukprot:624557-Amphidinium_carterae.2
MSSTKTLMIGPAYCTFSQSPEQGNGQQGVIGGRRHIWHEMLAFSATVSHQKMGGRVPEFSFRLGSSL